MNKSYRSVWNEALGAWVAVAEIEGSRGKANTCNEFSSSAAKPAFALNRIMQATALGLLATGANSAMAQQDVIGTIQFDVLANTSTKMSTIKSTGAVADLTTTAYTNSMIGASAGNTAGFIYSNGDFSNAYTGYWYKDDRKGMSQVVFSPVKTEVVKKANSLFTDSAEVKVLGTKIGDKAVSTLSDDLSFANNYQTKFQNAGNSDGISYSMLLDDIIQVNFNEHAKAINTLTDVTKSHHDQIQTIVNTTSGEAITFAADTGSVPRKLGDTLNIKTVGIKSGTYSGNNLRTVISGDTLNIEFSDQPHFNSVSTASDIQVGGDLHVVGHSHLNQGATIHQDLTVAPNAYIDMSDNQIHRLAAGTADTDAVNVSQLKDAVNQVSKKNNTTKAGNNIVVGESINANGGIEYTVSTSQDLEVNSVTSNTATTSNLTVNGPTVLNGGASISNNLTLAPNTYINMGGNKVTNVAAGTDATDAVNVSQLIQVKDIAKKGWNLQTNGDTATRVAPGATVQFLDGKNIDLTRQGNNVTVSTADNVVFSSLNVTGQTSLGNVAINSGSTVDLGGNQINNLGAGTADTDAVNLKQLKEYSATAAKQSTTSAGQNIVVETGVNAAGGVDYKVSTANNLIVDSVVAGNTTLNTNGVTINGGPSITSGGINAGDLSITNVAAGVNTTDAVNVGQLEEVASIANKGWNLSTNTGATTQVAPGDTVDFVDGKNISVTNNGKTVTVATADDVEFTNVSVSGNTIVNSLSATSLNVSGDTTVNNLTATGVTNLNSLNVAGDTNLNNITVAGDSVFNGGATFNEGLTVNNNFTVGGNTTIDMGGNKVTNVQDGNSYHDAVNYGQVTNMVNTLADKPMTFAGNTGAIDRKLGQTLSITGSASTPGAYSGNNVKVDVDPYGVKVKIADNPIFTSITTTAGANIGGDAIIGGNTLIGGNASVAGDLFVNGDTTLNDLSINAGSTVDLGGNRITNVGDGQADSDAATIKQLKDFSATAGKQSTTSAGQNIVVETGVNAAGGVDYKVSTANNLIVDSVVAGNTTLNTNGVTINGGPSITSGGINAGDLSITNVAAGVNITDAVNVGQLEDVATVANKGWNLSTNTGATTQVAPGDTVDFVDGKNISVTNNGKTVTVATADDVEFTNVNVSGNTIVNSLNATSVNVSGDTTVNNLTATGVTNLNNLNVAGDTNLNNITVAGDSVFNGGATFNEGVTVNTNFTVGGNTTIDMGGNKITNVAVGTDDSDAATVGQIKEVVDTATNKPITFAGNTGSVDRKLGETLNITGGATTAGTYSGHNVKVDVDANGIQVKLADNPVFTSIKTTGDATIGGNTSIGGNTTIAGGLNVAGDSVFGGSSSFNGTSTFNDSVTMNSGLTVADGTTELGDLTVRADSTIDMGGNKVTNVAAGTDDMDAVNYSQLQAVESTANKGWNVSTNQQNVTNVAPGDTVDFVDGKNIKVTNNGKTVTVATADDVDFTNLNVSGNTTVNNLTATGDTNLANLNVSGDTIVNNLTATGDTKLTNLSVSGNTVVNSLSATSLNVSGDTKVNNLTASGVTNLNSLNVGGPSVFNGGATFNEGLTVNNNFTVGSDTTIDMGGNKITNVADGTADTDAATVGQLNTKVGELADTPMTFTGNLGSVDRKLGETLTIKGDAATAGAYTAANIRTRVDGNTVNIEMADNPIFNSVTIGDHALINNTLTVGKEIQTNKLKASRIQSRQLVMVDPNSTVNADTAALNQSYGITMASNTLVTNVDATGLRITKDGIEQMNFANTNVNVGGNRITNVAAGVNTTDAVNMEQLTEVANTAGQKITFQTNDGGEVKVGLGETLSLQGGATTAGTYSAANIKTVVENNQVKIMLAEAPVFNGGLTVNGETKLAGGVSINKNLLVQAGTDINMGMNVVSGVAAGVADTDAVNVSQLKDVRDIAEDAVAEAGKGWNLSDGKTSTNVAPGATATITNTDKNIDVKLSGTTMNVNLAQDIAVNSVTINNGGPVINNSGINMNQQRITNLGDAISSTDAVNLKQLNEVKNTVANSAWNLQVDGDAATQVKNGDTVAINSGNNIKVSRTEGGISIATTDDVSYNSVRVQETVKVGATTVSATGVQVGDDGPSITTSGVNAGNTVVSNVADGQAPSDVVNVSQLQQATQNISSNFNRLASDISRVERNSNAGSATAGAMANLPQASGAGDSMFSIAHAGYRGESAYAAGLSTVSENGKWVLKGSLAGNSRGHVMYGVGAGYRW